MLVLISSNYDKQFIVYFDVDEANTVIAIEAVNNSSGITLARVYRPNGHEWTTTLQPGQTFRIGLTKPRQFALNDAGEVLAEWTVIVAPAV